jgi:hypothetical protein
MNPTDPDSESGSAALPLQRCQNSIAILREKMFTLGSALSLTSWQPGVAFRSITGPQSVTSSASRPDSARNNVFFNWDEYNFYLQQKCFSNSLFSIIFKCVQVVNIVLNNAFKGTVSPDFLLLVFS